MKLKSKIIIQKKFNNIISDFDWDEAWEKYLAYVKNKKSPFYRTGYYKDKAAMKRSVKKLFNWMLINNMTFGCAGIFSINIERLRVGISCYPFVVEA
jgi:hypothetical protein